MMAGAPRSHLTVERYELSRSCRPIPWYKSARVREETDDVSVSGFAQQLPEFPEWRRIDRICMVELNIEFGGYLETRRIR
jgi:hypothetical protein